MEESTECFFADPEAVCCCIWAFKRRRICKAEIVQKLKMAFNQCCNVKYCMQAPAHSRWSAVLRARGFVALCWSWKRSSRGHRRGRQGPRQRGPCAVHTCSAAAASGDAEKGSGAAQMWGSSAALHSLTKPQGAMPHLSEIAAF